MNKEKEANGKIYNILKYYTSTVQYKVNIPCTKLLIGPINLLTTKVMMTMISGKKKHENIYKNLQCETNFDIPSRKLGVYF